MPSSLPWRAKDTQKGGVQNAQALDQPDDQDEQLGQAITEPSAEEPSGTSNFVQTKEENDETTITCTG